MVTVTAGDGSTLPFTPSGGGGYTAPPWVSATLTHNGDGSYTVRLPDGSAIAYDAAGQATADTDPNGYTTTLSYTGGLLAAVTDPAGRSLTFGYNQSGQLVSVTDPAGRVVAYDYDPAGDLIAVTDPAGRVTRYGYDSAHRITTMTDPDGHTTANSYNSASQVIEQVDPIGRVTGFAYGSEIDAPEMTTVTNPSGSVSVVKFDNDWLTSTTVGYGSPLAATTSQTHDASDNVTSFTDPAGHTSSYSYDASGNMLTATDPDGRTTSYSYDPAGDLTASTDPLGVTTSYSYDPERDLTSVATPNSSTGHPAVTSFGYGDGNPGELTSVTDPDGNTSRFGYDPNGDLTSVTDPNGHTTSYTYGCPSGCLDNIGWPYSTTSPTGGVTTSSFDADGNKLSSTDPDGHRTTSSYDADGNVVSVTDPDGNITTTDYNADGQPVSTVQGAGTAQQVQQQTGYDAAGDLTSQTDGRGATRTYSYDLLGQLTSVTEPATPADPGGTTTSYSYNPDGSPATVSNPAGRLTSYGYDPAGQLTAIYYSDGTTPDVRYAYDGDGRRTQMNDGTGTSRYTYNSLGQLVTATNGPGATVRYTFDPAGQLTALGYPDGRIVTRTFDPAGQLTGVDDGLGNHTGFGYDPDGNLTQISYPNNVVETSSYDKADNLTALTDTETVGGQTTTLAGYSYGRDNAGQLTSQINTVGATQTPQTAYTYTSLNQLASTASQAGEQTLTSGGYSYDKAGNLTGLPDGTTQNYNPADQLTSRTGPAGVTTNYTYTAAGDRATAASAAATLSYGYNQADQLTSVGTPTLNATYGYDGDGLRTSAQTTIDGTPSSTLTNGFAYDLAAGMPLILTDGALDYIYGPGGLPIEQIQTVDAHSVPTFLSHDQSGSTRILTDLGGVVVGTYQYDPYGTTVDHTGVDTPLQYDGQYHDPTGLYYLRARYYDPQTGQFLTRDPLEAITGQPYGYAGNDPLNSADPTGLGCPWWDLTCYAYQAVYAIGGGIDWTASFVSRHFGDIAELGAGAGCIIATGGTCFALVISATALQVSQDHFVGHAAGVQLAIDGIVGALGASFAGIAAEAVSGLEDGSVVGLNRLIAQVERSGSARALKGLKGLLQATGFAPSIVNAVISATAHHSFWSVCKG